MQDIDLIEKLKSSELTKDAVIKSLKSRSKDDQDALYERVLKSYSALYAAIEGFLILGGDASHPSVERSTSMTCELDSLLKKLELAHTDNAA